MAHILQAKTRAEATPKEWLPFGAQLGKFVNNRADRTDVIAFVGDGAGQDHAACFIPRTAEIELNLVQAFVENVKPRWIGDWNKRDTLFDWPKAAGAVLHEASHARWSTWDLERHDKLKRDRREYRWATILEMMEETRIEALAARRWPEDRCFLRASAMGIIIADLDIEELKAGSLYGLSQMMLLTLGRRDGKILTQDDVQPIEDLCLEAYGRPLLDRFQDIWNRVNATDDVDPERVWDRLVTLAKEWMALLPEEESEEEEGGGESGEGMPGAGDGDGEISPELQEMLEALEEMLADAQASAEIGAADDAADQEEQERWAEQVTQQNSASQQQRDHEQVADRVFGKSTADIPDRTTTSRIVAQRLPTPAEHSAAVILARELEKARYRDRVETEVMGQIPPGRLRTREAVLGQAQLATGQVVTAEPWRQVHRKHVEDPKLRIGVMVDISGSMRSAMEPMAVTAWLLAEAGYRIQAQVAQVYYGNSAFPTLKPGQRLPKVVVRSATDGTERFDQAFKALDGKLELLQGTGARLLVICSDTCYTGSEVLAFERWTARAIAAGVGVICMTYDNIGGYVRTHETPSQVEVITKPLPAVEAARVIGAAAVKALTRAGAGR